MTQEERITWIKDKLAPLFNGMNGEDVKEILYGPDAFNTVLSQVTVSLIPKT